MRFRGLLMRCHRTAHHWRSTADDLHCQRRTRNNNAVRQGKQLDGGCITLYVSHHVISYTTRPTHDQKLLPALMKFPPKTYSNMKVTRTAERQEIFHSKIIDDRRTPASRSLQSFSTDFKQKFQT